MTQTSHLHWFPKSCQRFLLDEEQLSASTIKKFGRSGNKWHFIVGIKIIDFMLMCMASQRIEAIEKADLRKFHNLYFI